MHLQSLHSQQLKMRAIVMQDALGLRIWK